MEGFSFVTPVTGHNRNNTGKEEEEDDDDDLTNAVTSISLSISAAVQDRV
jgi:hypothetical protein